MKKWLIIVMILVISIFGAKTISTVRASQSEHVAAAEAAPLKTRQLALQKDGPILPKSKLLDVPLINQMAQPKLYNGCEVTSLAMILNYHGINVTKNELAENIKTVPLTYANGKKGNPNVGFVGNMAKGPGLGVYNGPIFDLAQKYAGNKVVNLTNSPFTDLLKKVSQGLPVWIITTSSFAPVSVFEAWNTPQGKIKITFSEHSVAITGYDENHIYVNDPYGVKNRKLSRESFIKAWKQMGSQAVVIEK
ncbi:C39 family peptidase [Neobacillus mesonae]|uniref:C39 family peptidase n=1 Tax=Neobacillus mesonae TaxID=1193713 RepID=UPI00203CC8E6|nr:C39 family peptidase [Neobacillus mesonae]MCM3569163.1 C39 family peptidase [Neobacillus mesonae]